MFARRHAAPLALAASLALSGAQCLDTGVDPDEERKRCEEVCVTEADCELRSEDECLAALCDDDGFKTVDDVDLGTLDANECEQNAEDCAELAACSCPDSCARVADCTGDDDPQCEDTCNALIAQTPEDTYQENRCKMESTCEDLPACGGV